MTREAAENSIGVHVQIQPDRALGLDVEAALNALQGVAAGRVTHGEDDGRYINVDFRVRDVGQCWAAIRQLLHSQEQLASCSLVCCEGRRGWDDYLLLHHFDPNEPTEDLIPR